jgi:hypothetical protein
MGALSTLAAIFVFLTTVGAYAQDCPAASLEERLQLIETASSCVQASHINDLCSEATGVDTIPSQVVIDKCEMEFVGKLSRSRLTAYRREIARCERKYANQRGTMYASFTMYCMAHVAVKFSRK